MVPLIVALVLLILSAAGMVLRKTYFQLPERELKRRAGRGDPLAAQLYRAAAYGSSLRGLLWVFILLTSATGIYLLTRAFKPVWLGVILLVLILWLVYSLLPGSRLTAIGTRFTTLVTPIVAWLLNLLHPTLSRLTNIVEHRYVAGLHTRLFEKEDFLELIDHQMQQPDSRFSEEELEVARRALTFNEHSVMDALTPRKEIKTVLAGDTLGPILIDELHRSDQEFVLVKEKQKGGFVGLLEVSKLGIKTAGMASEIMQKPVYYLHEDDSLSEALHAFFVTNRPVFVVTNSFEEWVGIITVENILRQLLGHVPGDDFDQYADIAAVAGRHTSVKTAEEVVE